jgi:hypothetical protein
MEKEQKEIDDYFDFDEDYEIEEFNPNNYIVVTDIYYELWQEAIRERDIIFYENPFEGFDYQSSEEELARIKTNILSVVSELLTPMQVVALYFFSNYDAESSNCPEKRKLFILKAMADSKSLNDYGIDDFNKFRHKLDKIEPSVFLELTNILYQSQIIRHLIIKPDNRSGILDRNLNLHEPDF